MAREGTKSRWEKLAAELIRETFLELGLFPEQDPFAQKLCGFFIQRLGQSIALDEAAAYMGRNKDYYGRLCKQKTGLGYHTLATKAKMASAKALLVATGETVKAVSKTLGYASPDYFSQLFKGETGLTPGQYRVQAGAKEREDKKEQSDGASARLYRLSKKAVTDCDSP